MSSINPRCLHSAHWQCRKLALLLVFSYMTASVHSFVENAHYVNRLSFDSVQNQVLANVEASIAKRQVVPIVAEGRILSYRVSPPSTSSA